MASLYKRSRSPFWWIQYRDPLRGVVQVSTKTKNRKEAEEKLKEIEYKMLILKHETVVKKSEYLFTNLVNIYFEAKRSSGISINKTTQESYNYAIKMFVEACGDKWVYEYVKADQYKFLQYLGDDRAQSTKSSYLKWIYAIFRWFEKEHYIKHNPFERIREKQKVFSVLSDEEVKVILDYAKGTKFYYPVKFMLLTGFRINEVCNLKNKDIKNNTIYVFGKGSKEVYLPIIEQVKALLNEIHDPTKPEELIFDISKDSMWRFWQRMRKATGLHEYVVHDMRKYCLSHMANCGVNPYFLMHYARHTDIKTTLKYYLQVDNNKLVEEINTKVTFKV